MFIPGPQFSPNKIFFHSKKLRQALNREIVYPIMYEISLAGWCTEKCTYCFSMHNHSAKGLSKSEVRRVLLDIRNLHGKAVEFTGGGEPLLSPVAYDAILYARELGLSVGIITNGTRIDSRLADAIASSASYCRVSIDSLDPTLYKKIRGTVHLTDALKGIHLLVNAKQKLHGKVLIGAHIVWINQSIEDIRRTATFFSQFGIDFLQIRPVDNIPGVNNHLRPAYTQEQLAELLDLVSQFKKGSFWLTTSADKWNEIIYGRNQKNYHGCAGANFSAAIGHDYHLYLCCSEFGNPNYSLGNLSDHSLEELLSSTRRRELIDQLDHKECLMQCRNHHLNKLLDSLSSISAQVRESLIESTARAPVPLHYEFL